MIAEGGDGAGTYTASKMQARLGKSRWLRAAAGAGFVLIANAVSFLPLQTPSVVPAGSSPERFSAERAFEHVRIMAQRPHPTGSQDNARVREYLLEQLRGLGLEPRVQSSTVRRLGGEVEVHNVIAVLPGTVSTGTLMLSCHYDSVAASPGASDDAAAVAAVLETVRALRHGRPLQNDLAVLFTDAEEIGLLGARAFARGDPIAPDTRLVLNFEARGTSGPVFMFQTSGQNRWLIREFIRAVRYPLANSISAAVYRRMPNGTDLSVFMDAGMAGMDFAFIGSPGNYHTPADSPANLDLGSLQHQGEYMLPLVRHFGSIDLAGRHREAGDAVYFNALGHWCVWYPAAWVWPLSMMAILAAACVIVLNVRGGRLGLRAAGVGALGFALALVVGVLVGYLVQWLFVTVGGFTPSAAPGGRTLRYAHLTSAAILITSMAGFVLVYRPFLRRWREEELTSGVVILWGVALVALTWLLPAGTYLLLWPLALWVLASLPRQESRMDLLRWTLPPLAAILLFTPLIVSLYTAIPLVIFPGGVAIALLALGMCLPQLAAIFVASPPRR